MRSIASARLPQHLSYQFGETSLDTHDLDQVGITLVRMGGKTGIIGLAKKDGVDVVTGAMTGDEILSIDGQPVSAMTRGELLAALHGTPGRTSQARTEAKQSGIDDRYAGDAILALCTGQILGSSGGAGQPSESPN
jgi:hypothetical protein